MAYSRATGDDISEVDTPLLDSVVAGYVDFEGRPSVRSKSGCWKSASFVIGAEVAERFAYFGISSNLISYLTGPLGQTTATAASNVNVWSGTSALLPLLGACVSESFFGRYRMIIFSNLLYILGLGSLSLSAALHSLNSSYCSKAANDEACSSSRLQIIFFFFSLYLVALAQGGHKPCLQAFGANQFDEDDENECKAKSPFFNWWCFFTSLGILVARVVLSYIQENLSWELGFGIPCIVMCFALIIFLLGTMTYRFQINSDGRNPFVSISHVFIQSARNFQATPTAVSVEKDAQENLAHKDARFSFLNKALLAPDGSRENGNDCNIRDIEDAKAILGLVPIWATCLGYAIVLSQVSTLFTKQGATMDRHINSSFQMPAASLLSFISLTNIVIVPIYDRIIVPIARAVSKEPSGLSMLQRIGVGVFLSIFSMVIAAIIERKRLITAIEYGLADMPKATIPMGVWWLVPQYMILGISEVFTLVGLQEFFYDQVPIELKSLGPALYFSVLGTGNFLSSFLISVIEKATSGRDHDGWFSDNLNRAHLDYFYWLLAGISAFAFAAYVYFASSYAHNEAIHSDEEAAPRLDFDII
ncbi:hypothetical protein BUALT_Bualt08G0142100 [Buddleja alternifolia]|uniref:NPF family transporter n=1 Tax=Buddleja alternifolia TaxID=168488 RepID=A0AAV6X6P5_9LAMI|nr:hypothetical protein BUALT_Bualt08G0142100 [Buddleja alternifolia]